MTWAKVDDTLHAHRKVRLAGLEAMGLWLVALSYCAQHITDGHLRADEVTHLALTKKRAEKLAGALVSAGLWDTTADGWCFHDWEHYQPTRASVLAERARKVEAGRKGGQASAQARGQAGGEAPGQARAQASAQAPTTGGSGADTQAHARARARPVPSRPSIPSDGGPEAHRDPEPCAETAANMAAVVAAIGGKR